MTQNSSTPEKHMPRTEKEKTKEAPEQQSGAATTPEALDERILSALHSASDKKAIDLALLDLRGVATFTDYFLIASGANQRQVQAIADAVVERLKEQGTRSARVEGYNAAEWVLVDYGDFIVHVFEEKARRFYDLERLWRDAVRVPLPPALRSGDEAKSSLRTER